MIYDIFIYIPMYIITIMFTLGCVRIVYYDHGFNLHYVSC